MPRAGSINNQPYLPLTYRGHIAGGAIASAVVARFSPPEDPIIFAVTAATLLGALLPDIDHSGSWISRRFVLLAVLYRIMLSNPLTWLLAASCGEKWKSTQISQRATGKFRWVDNCAARLVLGPKFPRRIAHKMSLGHDLISQMIGHRRITHSLLGLFLSSLLLLVGIAGIVALVGHYFDQPVTWSNPLVARIRLIGLGYFAGHASHIILDMMTPAGVPLLLPLSPRRFWLLPKGLRVSSKSTAAHPSR